MPLKIIKILTEYGREYGLENEAGRNSRKKVNFSIPKIFHGGVNYDLNKRWYVYYSFRHPDTAILVRQSPIYFNVNKDYHTKDDRLKFLFLVRDKVEYLLRNGYSPYVNKEFIGFFDAEGILDSMLAIKKSHLKASSYKDYLSRINQFKTFLDQKKLLHASIRKIHKKHVIEYLNSVLENSSARNRNNARSVLSTIFGLLEDNDYIDHNFVPNIRKLKTRSKRSKTYSQSQLDDIFHYLESKDPILLLFIQFVSYNFLRPIEVCRLKVGDINFDEKKLFVQAKNKESKLKIIPKTLFDKLDHIKDLPKDYYVFTPDGPGYWETNELNKRNYFSKRFKKVKATLNLSPEYTLYSFRHTFISRVYNNLKKRYPLSESIDKIMLITGHTSILALKSYLRDIDADLPED